MTKILKKFGWCSAVLGLVFVTALLPIRVAAQDQYQQQDDPPSRVARIGYMEGSVSFQPAGETEWGASGRESANDDRRQNLGG